MSPTPAKLVVAVVCAAILVWLDRLISHPAVMAWNLQALLVIHQVYTTPGAWLAVAVTSLAEPVLWLVLGVAIAGLLLIKRMGREAVTVAAATLGSAALTFGLKEFGHEARPHLFTAPITEHGYGFPSGHSLVSTCLFLLFALLWTEKRSRRHARFRLLVAALVVILMVGFTRVYLGVHWPTDVLGGYVAGLGWLAVSWTIYQVTGKGRDQRLSSS